MVQAVDRNADGLPPMRPAAVRTVTFCPEQHSPQTHMTSRGSLVSVVTAAAPAHHVLPGIAAQAPVPASEEAAAASAQAAAKEQPAASADQVQAAEAGQEAAPERVQGAAFAVAVAVAVYI